MKNTIVDANYRHTGVRKWCSRDQEPIRRQQERHLQLRQQQKEELISNDKENNNNKTNNISWVERAVTIRVLLQQI